MVASSGGFVVLRLHVKPGARADGIVGRDPWRGALIVQVKARAQKGAANLAVCETLASALGIAPADVVLERGATSREKTVRVAGVSADRVRRLGEAPP